MSSHAEFIPRGAYAPRSCFAVRTSADEKTIFAIHIRTSGQERRASARRGFVNRIRNGNAVNFGASNPHAECIPRGAYAPRSCFAMRTSADEKTIFAIHIRTSGQERRPSARRGNETHLQDGSLCVQRTTPPAAAGVSQPSASPVGLWGMANGNVGEQDDRHPPTLPC